MSDRAQLASDLSALLHLFCDSGYVDFKECHEPAEDYSGALKLGWVSKSDEGGPWRRISLTIEGMTLAEKIFNLVESPGTSEGPLIERPMLETPSEQDLDDHRERILRRHRLGSLSLK
jgi:hypothetical protein